MRAARFIPLICFLALLVSSVCLVYLGNPVSPWRLLLADVSLVLYAIVDLLEGRRG